MNILDILFCSVVASCSLLFSCVAFAFFRCAFGLLMLTVNYVLIVIKGLSLLTRFHPEAKDEKRQQDIAGRIPVCVCVSGVEWSGEYANNKIQLG